MQAKLFLIIISLIIIKDCEAEEAEKLNFFSTLIREYKLNYPVLFNNDPKFIKKFISPSYPYVHIHNKCFKYSREITMKKRTNEKESLESSNVIIDATSFPEASIISFLEEYKDKNIITPWFIVHNNSLNSVQSVRVDQRIFFIDFGWNLFERYRFVKDQSFIVVENQLGKVDNGLKLQNKVLAPFLKRRQDFKGIHLMGLVGYDPPNTYLKETFPYSGVFVYENKSLV